MRNSSLLSILMATAVLATPTVLPTAASAQTRVYHGRSHHHYRCRRSRGTTGLLAGAGAGGLGAAALGAGPVGLAAGVIGGGLLGRHLDKRHDAAQNRRNGC
jgi:outer membrane lipoprotein SlyB